MAVAAILLLVAWALATPLALVPRLTNLLRTLDVAGLIPDWRFFAPKPGRADLFLLYRGVGADAAITRWHEVTAPFERRFYNFIWNPGRRERKAFLDMVSELASQSRRQPDRSVQASVAYIALLQVVSSHTRRLGAAQTQFLILSRDGLAAESDMRPALVSDVHHV